MNSTLNLLLCSCLVVLVLSQELNTDDANMDKRARSFAFAKRARSFAFAKRFDPYPFGRQFAFAKRSIDDPEAALDSAESEPLEKRARFAFAKRARFAFAKRARFAFA